MANQKENFFRQGAFVKVILSLCTYFFCVPKAFQLCFKRDTRMGRINGVSVCKRAPQISHLFFVDVDIIFYRATLEEAIPVSQILKGYEWGLG